VGSVRRLADIAWSAFAAGVFVFVALTLLAVSQWVEQIFFPVNTNWTVDLTWHEGPDLYISGTMAHVRDCDYVPPPRARDSLGENVLVVSLSKSSSKSWAVSDEPQRFGPWLVPGGAGKQWTFYQKHICHPLWGVTSVLGSVDDRADK
jgi:hypothetical protein